MKNNRQKQILAIITEHDVETQEELIARLKASGFKATQATVSRDIKELKLIKIATDNGQYKYVSTMIEEGKPNAKYHTILRETVTAVKRAGSLVVVRTYDGMAMAAAAAIDSLQMNCVYGTIAGDDTIFVAVSDEIAGELIEEKLSAIIAGR
jgi:transcriptional regulator of arginine metabolism